MDSLQPITMQGINFNIVDHEKFKAAIRLLKESLHDGGVSLFCADNVITWNRNLSFLRDPFYVDIIQDPQTTKVQKSVIWRTATLLYFAEMATGVEGDFVEIGCNEGFTAERLLRRVDLAAAGKQYYLYDLFEWKEGDRHTRLQPHNDPDMYRKAVERFAGHDNVRLIKGYVPDSFELGFPEKIAFAHIDLNQPDPEAAALKAVLPRLSKGGAVVFDDYGWLGYQAQKIALDPIAEHHGMPILELPTGQGVLLNR